MAKTLARAARRATPAALALALGLPLLAPGASAPAAAATLIQSCPYTITRPGTYLLARDLTCPGEDPAIRITADGVRVDLGGRTLTGDGDPDTSGDGVLADGSGDDPITGLRVANGTVTGFLDGVRVAGAPGARITAVTATGNDDDDGVEVEESLGARVEGGTFTGNGFGIYLDDCDGCRATGSRAEGNRADGILADDAPRARIAGNTLAGNGGDGLDVRGAAPGAVVAGNRADANGGDGIVLDDARVDGGLVRGNTANGNGDSGIEVDDGATGNRLEGNRATGNGGLDLEDFNLPEDCANTWRGNRFATDNEGDGPAAGCIR